MAQHVLVGAPEHFALIGFSMGGYVARHIACLVPKRVQALVLVATSARADTPEQARCPVLLVHPAADRWTDVSISLPFFEGLRVPKRLVMLENAGHFPVEE